MARFRGSICSVGLSPVLSGNTPCSFRSRISKLEVLLSKTEQVGPSAPWDMPKWTLFRRPATAVHKSNLRSFPQRHIAWMSNITNTFRRVDRNSIGILISSRATPCFRSMRTSIVDTLLPHTRSIGMQSVPSPRSEPLHYKVKTEKLSLSLT